MNPQPQTIIHHSAVIVNRPNRRNEPPTVNEHSDWIGKICAFLPRNISWIAQQMNPKLCYIVNIVFLSTQDSLCFFPERRRFRGWHWCEKEMMMGKEGYFFDVKSSTKHRTSAESLADFCQQRITQFRDFLVAVTVNPFRRPHTFRALHV
jgi:hypothetical protein